MLVNIKNFSENFYGHHFSWSGEGGGEELY